MKKHQKIHSLHQTDHNYMKPKRRKTSKKTQIQSQSTTLEVTMTSSTNLDRINVGLTRNSPLILTTIPATPTSAIDSHPPAAAGLYPNKPSVVRQDFLLPPHINSSVNILAVEPTCQVIAAPQEAAVTPYDQEDYVVDGQPPQYMSL